MELLEETKKLPQSGQHLTEEFKNVLGQLLAHRLIAILNTLELGINYIDEIHNVYIYIYYFQ